MAQSIVNFISSDENKTLIEKLKKHGLTMEYLGVASQNNPQIENKTFVLTGTLKNLTRDFASSIIEQNGGKTSGSVTSKTSVVIVGENPGSKYDKALKLNIPIWTEEEFLNAIENEK